MKYPVIFLVVFFLQVIETAISRYAGVGFVNPDIGMVAAIYLGVGTGPVGGMVTAFTIGLAADMMSITGLIGANAAIYMLIALLSGLVRDKMEVWTIPGQMVLTIAFGIFSILSMLAFQALFEQWGNPYVNVWQIGLIGVVISTALSPILFIILDMLNAAVSVGAKDAYRINR